MKKIKYNAFSLAELLIVLMVIGVLAVLMISSMLRSVPDRNKVLFKKAYSVAEQAVGELANDETYYPYDPENIGFKNEDDIDDPISGDTIGGVGKFCRLFSDKMNTIGDVSLEGTCKYETTDGIVWSFPVESFKTKTIKQPLTIKVDVNGETKGPNKTEGEDQDIFQINVYYDGKVDVTGENEIEYLRSQTMNKEEEKHKK